MEEMRNSSHLADDPEGLQREIRTEGYALLRGLVDPEAAAEVSRDVNQVLVKHGYTEGDPGQEQVLKTPTKGQEADDYWGMYSEVLGLESVNALPHRSRGLQRAVRGLLGESGFTYPMKTVRLVFPQAGGGAAIPVHRDNRGGPWVQDMLTTWVALTDIDRTMGGFAILRRSHDYRYEAISEGGEHPSGGPSEPIPDMDSPEWVTTEWRTGDVVLFHCYTVHRGLYNRASRMRLSVDYRWQSTDHPVFVGALLPYHYLDKYPKIPDWDELSAHWSEPHWNGFPAGVEVTYDKWQVDNANRIPPSRLVDVRPEAQEAWRAQVRDRLAHEVPFRAPVPH